MTCEKSSGTFRGAVLGALVLASVFGLGACAADTDAADREASAGEEQSTNEGEALPQLGGTVVATVGDSWMHNTLGTGAAISGALQRAGLRIDNYAAQGVMLLSNNLFGRSVTAQIESSVIRLGTSRYKTVIATGGGNDIIENAALQADCGRNPIGATCSKKLTEIGQRWIKLWGELGAAGVKDFVLVSYASAAGSAPGAAKDSSSKLKDLCESQTVIRCSLIDTNDIVRSKADLILDGIHPQTARNNQIAQKVIGLMKEKGIAPYTTGG